MTVNLKDNRQLINSSVHSMPCKIHFDGDAKIDQYFTWQKQDDNDEEMISSFRGYPLCGKKISLPEGYKGRVFKENRRPNAENMSRHLTATHAFDSLTYWNWDKPPSKADPLISALDWIHIANAVHQDSESED